jgi:NAD(P)-dependent dehydrogenase (short-subunit alcohol dehydrogenase family)
MDSFPLQNAVLAVTNAGHGYGHAIARALGRMGANVIVVDPEGAAAATVASEIEAAGGRAIPIKADTSVQLEVSNTIEKIRTIFGSLAGVVHVADGASQTAFSRLIEAEWADLMDTHARSSYLLLRALQRHAGGAWATLVLPPGDHIQPQTRALRGYLTELTLGLSLEGVRVNALVPSRVAGNLELDAPLAEATVSLALPSSRGITGAVVRVALPPLPDPRANLPREVFE